MSDAGDPLGPNALPPFASLRAFEAVFRMGGIRKAALSLNIHHAVVSRHVRNLEQWLGLPLLTHSGHKLTLNEAGLQFHARISAAMVEIALATLEIRGEQGESPLRLWCVPGLSIQWLSRQLADLEREHPELRIELKPSDHPPNLLGYEADVDIRYFRDESTPKAEGRGLKFFQLARPLVMPVASPALADQLMAKGSINDLLDAPLLHEEHRGEWKSWINLNGLDLREEPGGQLYWQAHLALAAARLGRGVALANRYLVQPDIDRGDLKEIKLPGVQAYPLGSYMMVVREDRWSAPPISALRRFLSSRARATKFG